MTTTQGNPAAMLPEDDFGRVALVSTERREEALACLLSKPGGTPPDGGMAPAAADLEHAARFLQFAKQHAVSLDHLWAWEDRHRRFDTAVLAVPNAGRSAMVFASPADSARRIARCGILLDHACGKLTGIGLHLAQCLLDPNDNSLHAAFAAGGFQRLGTLSYLERSLRSRRAPPKPVWPNDVNVEAYHESQRDELITVLEATYEDTLDCPGLSGLRQTKDILEGHRAAGAFDPRLWTLLRVRDRAAGVLLLNAAADHASVELVYIGLAKWARGRGLGAQLLRHGLRLAANRPEHVMTLAVDEANAPALSLYEREGFRAVLRRTAMIRPLRLSLHSAP